MKKIFIATAMAALSAVLVFAGCASATDDSSSSVCEQHEVTSWVTEQEPTCTTEGVRWGYCTICYNKVYESIPIDGDAHVYGDWEVVAPTTERTGVAVKTCQENEDHYVSVTLPKLGDSIDYTSTVTVRPTAMSTGISVYTYPHELGDITFEVEIDSSGVQTVSDAVSIGTSDESHNLVRSGSGTRGDKKVESGVINDTVLSELESSAKSFSYEYYGEDNGDNIYNNIYTYINTDDGAQYYMGIDDGEIYGVLIDANGTRTNVTTSSYFYGFRYYETYTDTLNAYYGTENFVSNLYAYGKNNYNGDFTESVQSDGSYFFSFGVPVVYGGGTGGALFSKIQVTFTLNDDYMIDSLYYYSVTYENDSETYDTTTKTWGDDATFDFDEDGYAYVKTEYGTKYIESYTVTQVEKTADDELKTNPYQTNARFYSSFDVTYNGEVIDENTETIDLVAGSTTSAFAITNLVPEDVVNDSFTFYYKTADMSSFREVNYGTLSSEGIFVYATSSGTGYKLQIKSNISGDVTFKIATRNVEKQFTVNFISVAPTKLYPTVYAYDSSTGYIANTSSGISATATAYEGQPVYYKATLDSSEEGTCTDTFTSTVTGTTSDGADVTSDDYFIAESISLDLSTGDTVSVSSFAAYTAGTYYITLTSTEDDSVYCRITVKVSAMPDLAATLSGTYTGTFGSTKAAVSVTFGSAESEVVYTEYEDDGTTLAATYTKYTVTAKVTYDDEINTIICTYYMCETADGKTYAVSSSYARLYGAENILESQMQVGEGEEEEDIYDEVFIFRITFNESYVLTITHSLGEAYGSVDESANLTLSK